MRKRIAIILGAVLLAAALTACGGPNKSYDYTVPEKVKEDLMWDVEAISAKAPAVEQTGSVQGVTGLLISGESYLRGGDSQTSKAFALLGYPQTKAPAGGYPAVLLLHGGGGQAYPEWVKYWNALGYVALALDLNGQMYDASGSVVKNPAFLADGSYGSVGGALEGDARKNTWTYQIIAFCMHANNYLRSLADVDSDKIGVTGISWGGFTTCILAGVDKRFAAFAPVYGCGNLMYDSWGLATAGLGGLDGERRAAWAALYDPTAYLPYATKPMLFVSGADDTAFSPWSHKASTADVPGKTFFSYRRTLDHGHYWNLTYSVYDFMEHVLSGRKPDVNILSSGVSGDGRQLQFTLEDFASVDTGARLVYTTDDDADTHKWTWTSRTIELAGAACAAEIPEGATACFVEVYGAGESEARMSTDWYFLKDIEGLH